MSVVDRSIEQMVEEELAKMDPAVLQYLEQLLAENAPSARKVVQNALDESIPQETQKSLQKPLLPKGWMDVHEEIEKLPYCEIQGQITKVFLSNKCDTCKVPGKCIACYENEKKYHTLVSREEAWELEEKGFARIWGAPKRISESKQKIKERKEGIRLIRLTSSVDKLCEEYLEQNPEKRREREGSC